MHREAHQKLTCSEHKALTRDEGLNAQCLSPNISRAGARVKTPPAALGKFGFLILPPHCQCVSASTPRPEQCGAGTHQLEEQEVENIKEKGMGRGLSGPLAAGNGAAGDAVTPLPAAQVHLESLASDGHQLQCNRAIFVFLFEFISHLCWQGSKAPKGRSSFWWQSRYWLNTETILEMVINTTAASQIHLWQNASQAQT